MDKWTDKGGLQIKCHFLATCDGFHGFIFINISSNPQILLLIL